MYDDEIEALRDQIARLDTQLTELAGAWCDIHEWTMHHTDCALEHDDMTGDEPECTCGLHACEEAGHKALNLL